MRSRAISAAILVELGVILLAGWALSSQAAQEGAPAPKTSFPESFFYPDNRDELKTLEGGPAPALSLSEFINGQGFTNDDLMGKITVVDFWATWFRPCVAAIPRNNAIARKYSEMGVQVIGVCTSKSGQEKLAESVEEHKIDYLVAKDSQLQTQQAWGVRFYPTCAIVDRQGIVRGIGLMPDKVEEAIQLLLKEQPPEDNAEKAQAGGDDKEGDLTAAASSGLQAKIDPAWLEGSQEDRAKLKDLTKPEVMFGQWINAQTLKDGEGLVGRLPEGTKLVLVDFWATWCGPCIASIPRTNELQEKYREQGLVIIGVCNTRGGEKMSESVQQHGIKYPVVADIENRTVTAFRVNGFPDYYFLDAQGNILAADVKNARVEDVIKALLAGSLEAAAN